MGCVCPYPGVGSLRTSLLAAATPFGPATLFPHVTRVESLVDGDPPLDKEDYESVLITPSPMTEAMVRAGEKLMVGDRAMLLYVIVGTSRAG